MITLWIALIVAVLCIIPVTYVIVTRVRHSSDQIVKVKRYRFNGRYLLFTAFRRDSHSYIVASIEADETTFGNSSSSSIYRYKYNEYFESDDDAIRATVSILVASFKNAIKHIEQESADEQKASRSLKQAESDDSGKCSVRCPDGCDCMYSENAEM
jgi:hypothetical protein